MNTKAETKIPLYRLFNSKNGQTEDYFKPTYTKLNSVYGYLAVCGEQVCFFYSYEGMPQMDVLYDYKVFPYSPTSALPTWELEFRKMNRCSQRQDGTQDQLKDLIPIADKLGFYDAADFLKQNINS